MSRESPAVISMDIDDFKVTTISIILDGVVAGKCGLRCAS